MWWRNNFWWLFLSVFFSSCGYRWGRGGIEETYKTISVPYVLGDDAGLLTSAIIHQLAATGALEYRNGGGELILSVCLKELDDEKIGFIYAPESNGSLSNIVVSNESRLVLFAEVCLIERCSGNPLWGPIEMASSLSFDFEPDLSQANVHTESIGQLEMHPLAKDTALPALYFQLAEKIVDYVNNSW